MVKLSHRIGVFGVAQVISALAPSMAVFVGGRALSGVAEALIDGKWQVVDATGLAPRTAMVRIATGRDASDTAFMTVAAGLVDLGAMEVTAVAEPDLPGDDVGMLTQLH